MSDHDGNQIKHKNKTLVGVTLILLGLLLNKWVIERFASDGSIESPSYIIQILVVQLLLIFSGIYLITNRTVLKRVCIVIIFLVPFIAFSIVNIGSRLLDIKSENVSPQETKATESTAQIMLERVISSDDNKIADLSLETGEILYSPGQTEFPLKVKVPEGGVLDTAIGIDPLIRNIFMGNVYFKVSIVPVNGNQQTVFKDVIDLSSLTEKDFIWRDVGVNLSEYAGSEITLKFSKGYNSDSPKKPEVIYDLVPTDFMYWRTPNVRPEKLRGKRNVILISLDTLRADHLHYMGYHRETSPNLDRLTQNGTFFTMAVSQAPWTTPSHFSIFTSTYPSVNKGNQTIQTKGRHWNGKLPTMAGILRDKGYVTAAFTGKGSISAKFGFYRGFDFYNETSSFTGEGFEGKHKGDVGEIFNKAMQWLNNNKHRSFFLFIHTYEPHAPYSGEYFVRKEGCYDG